MACRQILLLHGNLLREKSFYEMFYRTKLGKKKQMSIQHWKLGEKVSLLQVHFFLLHPQLILVKQLAQDLSAND